MKEKYKQATILAIESSCDDTSAAVIQGGKVLANLTAGQEVHEAFGGVVPELASRAHMKNIYPLVDQTIKSANISLENIDAIAFTRGPGLIGSLIVGVNFAKALALGLNKPLIEVNHMQAHVGAHYIDNHPQFPFICLTVSGGHTQLVLVRDFLDMEILGESLDDAAGEAFDKAAKLFGLPYPGGPELDRLAQNGKAKFEFAKPKVEGLDFSFSGMKTSILYFIQKQDDDFVSRNLNDLCASVQGAVVDVLINKLEPAAKSHGINEIAIAGGVSANSELRRRVKELAEENNWTAHIPQFEYCTDNAAMIGIVGYHKYLLQDFTDLSSAPIARWSLNEK